MTPIPASAPGAREGVALPRREALGRIGAWGEWRCFKLWWGLSLLYALGVPAGGARAALRGREANVH